MSYYNPSFDEIKIACNDFAYKILHHFNNNKPDYIIGLQRGGLIPAVHISHLLDVPLKVADFSHEKSVGDNKYTHAHIIPTFEPHVTKIVLVDDIIDTGYVISEFLDELRLPEECEIIIMTLYYKQGNVLDDSKYVTYSWKIISQDAPFINFPWEVKYEDQ